MTDIAKLVAGARKGEFGQVHILVGEEQFLISRAVKLLRAAATKDGIPGFNEDVFDAPISGTLVASAARTLPMMSSTRFVLLRNLDKLAAAELDAIAAYVEAPSPSTCFVATATKLDGRMKLPRVAKKLGVLIPVDPPKGAAISQFVAQEAKARGHAMDNLAVQGLVDAIGDDLAAFDDAIERLSLFVGEGKPIDIPAIEACVTRVRVETIWALVDAVSSRNEGRALAAVASLLEEREPPLRVLAMLARQLRMLAKMREALARGLRGPDAAVAAGAPPFKADELGRAARNFPPAALDRAFQTIALTDRALKGSKVPDDVVLVRAVSSLCR